MNELVRTTNTPAVLDAPSVARIVASGDEIFTAFLRLREGLNRATASRKYREPIEAAATIDNLLEDETFGQLAAHQATFRDGLSAYAPPENGRAYRAQLSAHLGLLLASYPTSNISDPRAFAKVLLDEVLTLTPALPAVATACSELRRTQRFMPAICEVVAAIDRHQERWQARCHASNGCGELITALEQLRADLTPEVDEENARLKAEREAQARAAEMLPVGTRVFHRLHGVGEVLEHTASGTSVSFIGSRTTSGRQWQVRGKDLLALRNLDGAPAMGETLVHAWYGRGAVVNVDAAEVTIEFEDGRSRPIRLPDDSLFSPVAAPNLEGRRPA